LVIAQRPCLLASVAAARVAASALFAGWTWCVA